MLTCFFRRNARAAVSLASGLALVAMLSSAIPVAAAEVHEGDSVVIASGQTIHDDVYAVGQTVTVLGTVDGDLFAAGTNLMIDGVVTGSVYAAGSSVVITGSVGRSLHAVGGTLTVQGPVATDAFLAGAAMTLAAPARVGRDLFVGGSAADVTVPVGRNVLAGGENVSISAPVGGDVRADVGNLRLLDGAAIAGGLTYTARRDAEIASGASVGGSIERLPLPAGPSRIESASNTAIDWLRGLIGMLALGLFLVLAFPGFTGRVNGMLTRRPWPSLGIGLAMLFATPVAAAIVFAIGLMVGGWWIGFMLLMLYAIALVVGYVLAADTLGQWLFAQLRVGGQHRIWALLVGLVVFGLIAALPLPPLVGVLLLIGLSAGLGAATLELTQAYRATRPVVQAAPTMTPTAAPAPGTA